MDYFAANDLAAFITSSGAPTETTGAGTFDSNYATKAINPNAGTADYFFTNPDTGALVTLTDAWAHCEQWFSSSNVQSPVIQLQNSAGTPVVRAYITGGAQIRLDYWNGAAWVQGADVFQLVVGDRNSYDLHAVAGAAGSLTLYINNSLALQITGLNAAVNNFASGRISGSSIVRISQVLVSDESTVGAKVASLTPNANGTYTAWVNDYTNLVKVGYNDATLVSSSTLDDKETYAASDAVLPPNYVISSVWLAIRARRNGSAPSNIKPLLRLGGVDYSGSYNFPGLNSASYGPSLAGFSLNPAGNVAWTIANVNAAELGFKTAA